jgi:ribosomal protein S17E
MTTITQTEIIERQQVIIDKFQDVIDTHYRTRSKTVEILKVIQELLTMNSPEATKLAVELLDKLIETIK